MIEAGAGRRVFGLDVIRAVAVLTVLVGHSVEHFDPPMWIRWFWGAQGILGVEIFYVLSGFLIGGILIRLAKQGRLHTPSMVWTFWYRRWARTLPLYFFFVLVYLRFDYLGVTSLLTAYPFFFFMQNFAWSPIPFFQHSWSLSVEEWFYFLFPLIFLWLAKDERSYRRPMIATCAIFIVVPLLLRLAVAKHISNFDAFNNQIRMVVVCRLDAIFFGVLLALIKVEWPAVYRRLRWCAIPGGLVLLATAIYLSAGVPGLTHSYWGMVLFFPALSLSIALTLPSIERIQTLGSSLLDRFLSYTSRISYSLYLGHICMLTLVDSVLNYMNVPIHGHLQTLLVYVLYIGAYYTFATITYKFVELPFLLLRDMPSTTRTDLAKMT